ncbi:Biorientation of chromosomes in cell division protein 1 [Orchesella cincta]|uniref:Biorientation of chromosomes in cell division protein 1 n=1 Tax=Orchesella cincta TaxID=48709 RepID=A0A1D2MZI3_ORCCI|nr:Biorientation of chromosomes in cell division protein 1 [Orchesella cincta]
MSHYPSYGTDRDRDRDRERDNFYHRRREWNRNRGRPWYSHGPNNWRWNRENYRDRPRRDPQVVLVKRTQVSPDKDEADGRYISVNPEKYRAVDRQYSATSRFESPYSQDGSHRRNTPYYEYSPANQQNQVGRQTSTAETFQHAVPYNHQNNLHLPPQTQTATSSYCNTDNESENIKQELIETCISNFKIGGDYDRIRKECLLDIDTKPAFLNVKTKVEDITSQFLSSLRFLPNMDKSKVRENLKQTIALSNGFQSGVETLVNQILMPKVSSIIRPMVEEEIYRCLNIERIPNTDDTSELAATMEEQSDNNNSVQDGLNSKKVDSASISEDAVQFEPVVCNESIRFELNPFPPDISNHENTPIAISQTESTMINGSVVTNDAKHSATKPDFPFIEPETNGNDFTSTNIETKKEVNITVNMYTETEVVSSSVAPVSDVDMNELTLSEDDHNCSNAESEDESPEFEKIDEISPPRIEMDIIPYETLNIISGGDETSFDVSNDPVSSLPLTSSETVNHDDKNVDKCYFLQPLPLFEQKRSYYSRIPPN